MTKVQSSEKLSIQKSISLRLQKDFSAQQLSDAFV